jgi:hypothetical protein
MPRGVKRTDKGTFTKDPNYVKKVYKKREKLWITPIVKARVAQGLHPDSRVFECDVCCKGPKVEVQQYGRFVAHPRCYATHQNLSGFARPPLDYEKARWWQNDSIAALHERMSTLIYTEIRGAYE